MERKKSEVTKDRRDDNESIYMELCKDVDQEHEEDAHFLWSNKMDRTLSRLQGEDSVISKS